MMAKTRIEELEKQLNIALEKQRKLIEENARLRKVGSNYQQEIHMKKQIANKLMSNQELWKKVYMEFDATLGKNTYWLCNEFNEKNKKKLEKPLSRFKYITDILHETELLWIVVKNII